MHSTHVKNRTNFLLFNFDLCREFEATKLSFFQEDDNLEKGYMNCVTKMSDNRIKESKDCPFARVRNEKIRYIWMFVFYFKYLFFRHILKFLTILLVLMFLLMFNHLFKGPVSHFYRIPIIMFTLFMVKASKFFLNSSKPTLIYSKF